MPQPRLIRLRPASLHVALAGLLAGGCAGVFGLKPGDHPVWTQPLATSTPAAGAGPATLTIELDNQITLADLRGVAVKLDGQLIRRQLMAPGSTTSDTIVRAGYKTSIPLASLPADHDVCVFAWYDGIDVLTGKQMMVTGERQIAGAGNGVLQMHVRLEPTRQIGEGEWNQLIAMDWTGGSPVTTAPRNCGVDTAVLASPPGGIGYAPGVSFGSLTPALPPPPFGR
jgi:hypothetical protein